MLSPSRGVVGGVGHKILYSSSWFSFHPEEWEEKVLSSSLTWEGSNLVHNTL
jgi:hypothetical protein